MPRSYLQFVPQDQARWAIVRDGRTVGTITKRNGSTIFLTKSLQQFSTEDISNIRAFMAEDRAESACASK